MVLDEFLSDGGKLFLSQLLADVLQERFSASSRSVAGILSTTLSLHCSIL